MSFHRILVLTALLMLAGCTSNEATAGKHGSVATPTSDGAASISMEATAAYINDLVDIDPDIVGEKPDRAVSRGRSQCSSVKKWPDDKDKLIELAGKRFTSPDHPTGFGKVKSAKILKAVRRHLCPTF
ncbi:hypothetical protein [Actinoplanes sp. NPDC051494]|uniref:hypothetical protein n=1 Tax=Actinoplanes sp. NPDC051494 TaxID=3363907 RepID=UPI0037BA2D91